MALEAADQNILETLLFYGRIGRPLTLLEIWRRSRQEDDRSIELVQLELDRLIAEGKVAEYRGFYWRPDAADMTDRHAYILRRAFQDVRTDEKWKKFIALRRIFRFLPFIEFVFASGSMAIGNAGPLSDFDVIIGAREKRIFTVRVACIVLFGMLGKRRKKLSHHDEASDKICLNHFVTRPAYGLSGPHNIYWEQLYKNLVPLFGSEASAKEFVFANPWAHAKYARDRRFMSRRGAIAAVFERVFDGAIGDFLEKILRALQRRRIEVNLSHAESGGYKSRIKYDDTELEFHPDTKRIEEYIGGANVPKG